MATAARQPLASGIGDERFFLKAAVAMTVTIVAGFSFQWLMGRSTFQSPLPVHAHAIVFMGWVAIYLLQNIFVATERMHLHRRLGWIAAGWLVPMLAMGLYITIAMVRRGQVPFMFRPLQFLVFDCVAILTFVGLTIAAIRLRHRTEWHRRLHFCGMAMLLAPAFGRLLPTPLLMPLAWEACFAAGLLFPIAGVLADRRRSRRAHPAWRWGIGTMLASLVLVEFITYGPLGPPLYDLATSGSPGAAVAPLDYAPPPAGPLMTGRN